MGGSWCAADGGGSPRVPAHCLVVMSLSALFEEGSRVVKSGELSPFALKEEYPLMSTGVFP